jgi:flagellar basal body rod protein FlgC
MTDAAFDIAADGMAAERSAMDAIAQRLAAGGTTNAMRSPSGSAESAFVPVSFSSALDDALSSADPADIEQQFTGGMQWASAADAGDPATDTAGVEPETLRSAGSDGDPIGQMIALVATGRAYDADVAALQAAKQMDVEASDIDKF